MTQELADVLIKNKKPLLLALAAAAVVALFLGGSFLSLVHNKLELRKLTLQSAQLDKEHEKLLAQKDLLEKEDPAYLERIARTEYHLVKPGETEFRFKTK